MLKMCSFWMVYAVAAFVLWRVARRQATLGEIVLPGVVLLSFVLIQAQMAMEGGLGGIRGFFQMPVYWRYHLPTWPLLIIVVAFGICELAKLVPRHAWLAVVALTSLAVGESARKLYEFERRYGREVRAQAAANEWAEGIIRADWKGPAECARTWNPHVYNSDRRPFVVDVSGHLAYRVGGSIPEAVEINCDGIWPRESPDYMFLPDYYSRPYARWFLKHCGDVMAERVFDGWHYTLYRKRKR